MIIFIIYTMAAIALILLFTCMAWYSRRQEQIAGERPCEEEPTMRWLRMIYMLLPAYGYVYCVITLVEQVSFRLNTSSVVEARIEDFRLVGGGKGNGVRYLPKVSFETPQGQQVMVETENRFFIKPTIGSTAEILYDTSNPTYVLLVDGLALRMGDEIYVLILSFVGLGMMFGAKWHGKGGAGR